MSASFDTAVQLREADLRQILDLSSEGVLVLQRDSEAPRIRYANSQFARLSGFTLEELMAFKWDDVCRDMCAAEIAEALITRDNCRATLLMESADGARWRSGVRIRALVDENGDSDRWLCQFVPPSLISGTEPDITAMWMDPDCAGTRQRFGRLDRIDGSSGLLRYERFRDFLERDISMATREKKSATVMLLRIMEFSEYRCTFGMNAANSCLGMIGKQVTAALRRRTDLCARMNDDTIVVAVMGETQNEIASVARRICENVDGLRIHNPRGRYSRFLTLRCAVTTCDPVTPECSVDSIIDAALLELDNVCEETRSA